MVLEPIGNAQVDVLVDGQQVSTEQITEDGELQISLDHDLSGIPLMSGKEEYDLDSPTGEEVTRLLFDIPSTVPVDISWRTMVKEDYDADVIGDEVIVRADGNEIHHNDAADSEQNRWDAAWMSGSTTVECSRAEVYANSAYADEPNATAAYFEVTWDASEAFSDDVQVNLSSRDVSFSPK